jgi:homoserine O-acetyltransferase/O-succinyltransferase
MTTGKDDKVFEAGDVALRSGSVFPSLRLAYQTYGELSPRKDNVIVYPTSFGAQHYDTEWLVQPGGALDSDRFFIIIPNLLSNGLSSSPSNSSDSLGDVRSRRSAITTRSRSSDGFSRRDGNDLLVQIRIWQNGNVSLKWAYSRGQQP